jgi:hypothetical protein
MALKAREGQDTRPRRKCGVVMGADHDRAQSPAETGRVNAATAKPQAAKRNPKDHDSHAADCRTFRWPGRVTSAAGILSVSRRRDGWPWRVLRASAVIEMVMESAIHLSHEAGIVSEVQYSVMGAWSRHRPATDVNSKKQNFPVRSFQEPILKILLFMAQI